MAEGLPLIDALPQPDSTKSKSEARRTISQGGAYVNNRQQKSIDRCLTDADLATETTIVLRAGQEELRVAASDVLIGRHPRSALRH